MSKINTTIHILLLTDDRAARLPVLQMNFHVGVRVTWHAIWNFPHIRTEEHCNTISDHIGTGTWHLLWSCHSMKVLAPFWHVCVLLSGSHKLFASCPFASIFCPCTQTCNLLYAVLSSCNTTKPCIHHSQQRVTRMLFIVLEAILKLTAACSPTNIKWTQCNKNIYTKAIPITGHGGL
jgi:hypothetical protein